MERWQAVRSLTPVRQKQATGFAMTDETRDKRKGAGLKSGLYRKQEKEKTLKVDHHKDTNAGLKSGLYKSEKKQFIRRRRGGGSIGCP